MNEIILIALLVSIIIFIIVNHYEKKQRHLEEQLKKDEKILFRYKNYKADGIEKYLETPEQRLARIFNALPSSDRQKLVEYAETLERKNRGND